MREEVVPNAPSMMTHPPAKLRQQRRAGRHLSRCGSGSREHVEVLTRQLRAERKATSTTLTMMLMRKATAKALHGLAQLLQAMRRTLQSHRQMQSSTLGTTRSPWCTSSLGTSCATLHSCPRTSVQEQRRSSSRGWRPSSECVCTTQRELQVRASAPLHDMCLACSYPLRSLECTCRLSCLYPQAPIPRSMPQAEVRVCTCPRTMRTLGTQGQMCFGCLPVPRPAPFPQCSQSLHAYLLCIESACMLCRLAELSRKDFLSRVTHTPTASPKGTRELPVDLTANHAPGPCKARCLLVIRAIAVHSAFLLEHRGLPPTKDALASARWASSRPGVPSCPCGSAC